MRSLTYLGSALATCGGLSYLVSMPFWALWVVSIQLNFTYHGCNIYVHYYSLLFNAIIHSNIHLFIYVIQSLFFSLFFLCMLVRILGSKIYFLCFFLASLLIALIYYFYRRHTHNYYEVLTKILEMYIVLMIHWEICIKLRGRGM